MAKIDNPLRKEDLLVLINNLNDGYRIPKFVVEDDNDVVLATTYIVTEGHVVGQDLFDMSVALYKAAKESYPKFMKLKWS